MSEPFTDPCIVSTGRSLHVGGGGGGSDSGISPSKPRSTPSHGSDTGSSAHTHDLPATEATETSSTGGQAAPAATDGASVDGGMEAPVGGALHRSDSTGTASSTRTGSMSGVGLALSGGVVGEGSVAASVKSSTTESTSGGGSGGGTSVLGLLSQAVARSSESAGFESPAAAANRSHQPVLLRPPSAALLEKLAHSGTTTAAATVATGTATGFGGAGLIGFGGGITAEIVDVDRARHVYTVSQLIPWIQHALSRRESCVVFLCGAPGAGKSYTAKQVGQQFAKYANIHIAASDLYPNLYYLAPNRKEVWCAIPEMNPPDANLGQQPTVTPLEVANRSSKLFHEIVTRPRDKPALIFVDSNNVQFTDTVEKLQIAVDNGILLSNIGWFVLDQHLELDDEVQALSQRQQRRAAQFWSSMELFVANGGSLSGTKPPQPSDGKLTPISLITQAVKTLRSTYFNSSGQMVCWSDELLRALIRKWKQHQQPAARVPVSQPPVSPYGSTASSTSPLMGGPMRPPGTGPAARNALIGFSGGNEGVVGLAPLPPMPPLPPPPTRPALPPDTRDEKTIQLILQAFPDIEERAVRYLWDRSNRDISMVVKQCTELHDRVFELRGRKSDGPSQSMMADEGFSKRSTMSGAQQQPAPTGGFGDSFDPSLDPPLFPSTQPALTSTTTPAAPGSKSANKGPEGVSALNTEDDDIVFDASRYALQCCEDIEDDPAGGFALGRTPERPTKLTGANAATVAAAGGQGTSGWDPLALRDNSGTGTSLFGGFGGIEPPKPTLDFDWGPAGATTTTTAADAPATDPFASAEVLKPQSDDGITPKEKEQPAPLEAQEPTSKADDVVIPPATATTEAVSIPPKSPEKPAATTFTTPPLAPISKPTPSITTPPVTPPAPPTPAAPISPTTEAAQPIPPPPPPPAMIPARHFPGWVVDVDRHAVLSIPTIRAVLIRYPELAIRRDLQVVLASEIDPAIHPDPIPASRAELHATLAPLEKSVVLVRAIAVVFNSRVCALKCLLPSNMATPTVPVGAPAFISVAVQLPNAPRSDVRYPALVQKLHKEVTIRGVLVRHPPLPTNILSD